MRTVTIDEVLSWNPCEEYTKEILQKLAGRKRKMSGLQILALKIPAQDRFWAILKHGFLSDRDLRLFACDCAEHVLHFFEKKFPVDKRPRECIEVARRFVMGEATADEMDAAGNAARDAGDAAWDAGNAARDAAWDAGDAAWAAGNAAWAARDAAGDAARDAAGNAARDAAGNAAGNAAWDAGNAAGDAAWDAGNAAGVKEQAWQVKRLKKYLEEKPSQIPESTARANLDYNLTMLEFDKP